MPIARVEPYDRVGNYTGWVDPAAAPRRATYAYRMRGDRLNYDFCLLGAGDEPVSVESLRPDGRHVAWEGRLEGDMQVFEPPDGSDINDGVFLSYDRRMLVVEAMDRAEIERFALRHRVSIVVPEGAG